MKDLKTCTKCKEEKSLEEFYFRKDRGIHRAQCKKCERLNSKSYAEENAEKVKAYSDKYVLENKEQRKLSKIKYYQKNKEKLNNDSTLQKRLQRLTDPLFKVRVNIRNLIAASLKYNGFSKASKTAQILGKSPKEFVDHLYEVSKVNPETHKVQIDHVIPVSKGRTEEEILALNHFSNFQWLTEAANNSKLNRFARKENVKRVLANHPDPSLLLSIIWRERLTLV